MKWVSNGVSTSILLLEWPSLDPRLGLLSQLRSAQSGRSRCADRRSIPWTERLLQMFRQRLYHVARESVRSRCSDRFSIPWTVVECSPGKREHSSALYESLFAVRRPTQDLQQRQKVQKLAATPGPGGWAAPRP